MKNTFSALLLLLLATPFLSEKLFAEEPKIGKLPDGTAFRIDNAGNEIVDQLAELELEKQTSDFRINALEKDLEEKERIIAGIAGREPSAEFYQDNKTALENTSHVDQAQKEVAALKSKLQEFKETKNSLAKKMNALEKRETEYKKLTEKAKKERVELEDRLINTTKVKAKEVAGLKERLEEYKRSIDTSEKIVASRDSEIVKLRNTIKKIVRDSELQRSQLVETHKAQLSQVQKTAIVPAQQQPVTRARYQFESQSPVITAVNKKEPRSETWVNATMRSQARKYVLDIEKNITLRNQIFAYYSKKPSGGISVKPRELKSTSGENFSSLRLRVRSSASEQNLNNMIIDLRSILALLQDDISLIKRLTRK
jgi:DNA repair exonuclease SbcCD ATPase subunit